MTIITIADLTNPETGNTYRQDNAAKTHSIALGTLVETNFGEYDKHESGLRLFVVEHSRDCDQTPLYTLSHKCLEDYQELVQEFKAIPTTDSRFRPYYKGLVSGVEYRGINEDSLSVIRAHIPKKE
jgi:hypothetical protein